jgi:hypothetical protein
MGDSLQDYKGNHGRSQMAAVGVRKYGAVIALLICIVMVAVGGLAVRDAQAATSPSTFTCAPGYVYSQQANGSIKQFVAGSSSTQTMEFPKSIESTYVNGLGIGANGSVAYAYHRTGNISNNSRLGTLFKYDDSTGWSTVVAANDPPSVNGLIAGAVNLKNGNFVFGGYQPDAANSRVVFRLSEYVVSSNRYVDLGYFYASDSGDGTSSNGDIAFDGDGNLSVVRSTAQAETSIFTITAAELSAAEQAQSPTHQLVINSTITGKISVSSPVNGIAFDSDGSIYLGTSNGSLYHYESESWNPIGANLGLVSTDLGNSTDLASCNVPPTLTLKKNLPKGRSANSDQFGLAISSGGIERVKAVTSGQKMGVQDNQAGPFVALAGQTYNISESMASGSASSTDAYQSSWQCVNGNDSSVISQGSGSSGSVTIPQTTGKGAAVVCTITNVPKSDGSISWSKVDGADTAKLLGGSVWELTGPTAGSSTTRTVEDCVAASAAACTGLDKDPVAGKFLVQSLVWGNYTLKEKTAPSGYELSDQVLTVTVNKSTTISVGPINNKAIPQASVVIKKSILSTSDKKSPGVGWVMSASLATGSPSGTALLGTSTQQTTTSGAVANAWPITFSDTSQSATVDVVETQQQGYEFSSGSCVVTSADNSTKTITLTGTSGAVTGITPGSSTSCEFVNKQQAGTATWSKTADDGHALQGSVWSLTYPDGQTKDITGDAQGNFSVANLPWGEFTLVEKQAPAGYQRDETEHKFTIDATHLKVNAVDSEATSFINNKQHVPALPMTGGTSTDLFMISGAVLLVLAAAFGTWHILSTRKRTREASGSEQ